MNERMPSSVRDAKRRNAERSTARARDTCTTHAHTPVHTRHSCVHSRAFFVSSTPRAVHVCHRDPRGFLHGTCGLLLYSFWLPLSCSVCFTHALSQRLPLPLRADRFCDGARIVSTDVEFHVAEDATPRV